MEALKKKAGTKALNQVVFYTAFYNSGEELSRTNLINIISWEDKKGDCVPEQCPIKAYPPGSD